MTDLAADDPYNLNRFLQAQQRDYEQALWEIQSGQKRTHWMWYIFPQLEGLSLSPRAHFYSIKSVEEANAYLTHPILGPRLLECADAVLSVEERSAQEIFGPTDERKLKSCATLFALVSPLGSAFQHLLHKYFEGLQDEATLELLGLKAHISEQPEEKSD